MELINGDCLIELEKIPDSSVDFVYLDLPYGQTSCKWDVKLDLEKLWKQLKRIAKNDRTPFFFSCTTKFGYELIGANPKWFRWDLVWEKNRAAGFLNAYRLPMRKHEMIYCFAKKTPEYDVSSHLTGKNSKGNSSNDVYLKEFHPVRSNESYYDKDHIKKETNEPLPTSVLPPTDDHELIYCFAKKTPEYDVSSHLTGKEFDKANNKKWLQETGGERNSFNKDYVKGKETKEPLPTSVLPSSWCKFNLDNKTGHRTAKPVKLMEFLLKYWSKPGDTVLDPTAGSGSMGIACKQMGRKFIGIERDPLIYELMKERIAKAEPLKQDTSDKEELT